MTSLKNVDAHGHRYWLKHPDGEIQEIGPHQVAPLAAGRYEISSVEPANKPVPHLPPPPHVEITNVGQETIFFTTPFEDFELKESESRSLKHVEYLISSKHIPPQ